MFDSGEVQTVDTGGTHRADKMAYDSASGHDWAVSTGAPGDRAVVLGVIASSSVTETEAAARQGEITPLQGKRNRALLRLLYANGLRVLEIASLK